MTKTVATGLLLTYLVILFGYGLSSLTHMWLHAVENAAHSHGHSSLNEIDNNQLHSISDHSKTLSKLNDGNQDLGNSETNTIVFSFVFWKKSEPELFNLEYSIAEEQFSQYFNFYNSRTLTPATPPPPFIICFLKLNS